MTTKLLLFKESDHLPSLLMYRYLTEKAIEFDVINIRNAGTLIEVFEITEVPTLIATDDYETFQKLEGYDEDLIDELLEGVNTDA